MIYDGGQRRQARVAKTRAKAPVNLGGDLGGKNREMVGQSDG
jgi:hypothetical protein